jgi:hypothetical protein
MTLTAEQLDTVAAHLVDARIDFVAAWSPVDAGVKHTALWAKIELVADLLPGVSETRIADTVEGAVDEHRPARGQRSELGWQVRARNEVRAELHRALHGDAAEVAS